MDSGVHSAGRHVNMLNFFLFCRLVVILSQFLDIGVLKENFCRFELHVGFVFCLEFLLQLYIYSAH